jgi:acyl dehydratase
MPFDRDYLTAYEFKNSAQTYQKRDTMLYGLGLGLGAEPTNPGQLKFVYEKSLSALPTMGVVLAHPGFWAGIEDLAIDWVNMLHVGQGLTMHRPLPVEGSVIGRSRVADVFDRGPGKGALLLYERDVLDAATGELFATVRQTLLCRGNGGFAGTPAEIPKPHTVPVRAPDHVVELKTLPQMALIYRLSGDMNPLHADPAVAAKAGFPQPILQGLATFGIAGFALIQAVLDYDVTGFQSLDVRFTAPVFPGETIRTELWQDSAAVSVRSTAVERGKVVIDNGLCLISAKTNQ